MRADRTAGSADGWIAPLRDQALLALAPSALSLFACQSAALLAAGNPCSVRERFRAVSLTESLHLALERVGGVRSQQDWIAELVAQLLPALATLDVTAGTLRLEIVHGQTCPKLHVDSLRWRIACTLVGAGTEYLPPGLAPGADDASRLVRVPTGVIAAMAGAMAGPGLWHRSPHACAQHPRLFVSLDVG